MKTKVILGLAVFAIVAFFPLSYLSSKNETPKALETIVLTSTNSLSLNDQIDGESAAQLISKSRELSDALNNSVKEKFSKKTPLYLFLNTPGGSIESGLEIIEALKGIGRPVNTITLFSASMGFQLAQNLGDRLILKNGTLMSHHAKGEFEGSFGGQPNQLDSRYQYWLDRIRELDEQTVKRTNGKQTWESYTKQYDHEMWLTGTKSVAQGYADRIVQVSCDDSLAGVITRHITFLGIGIDYDLDKCPINTNPMNIRMSPGEGKNYTAEMINDIKAKFEKQYQNNQRQALPMTW